MSAAPLDPVYLIGGTDRPKVELAIRRLRARVRGEDGSVEEFAARRHDDDGEGVDGEDAAGLCNALGLFGGTRLLVVGGAEAWGDDKKAIADLDALAAYAAAPAPDAVLALLTAGEVPKSRLRGVVEAAGTVLAFDLPGREGQREWLRKQASRAGADLDAGALTRLLELAGDDSQALASEVEKLGLWSRGETITAERIDELCVLTADTPPWDLTDALGDRRPADALRVLGRLLDGPDGDVPRWLPSIARHIRQLAVAQRVGEEGGGHKDIARELGLRSEFVARKLARQSARWSPEQLSAALVRIASVERETRGEGVLRDRFALERALAEAVGP
jgi:DNA polymerase-3 subunit delta